MYDPGGIDATVVMEVAAAVTNALEVVDENPLEGVASSIASMVSLTFTWPVWATDSSQSVILHPG